MSDFVGFIQNVIRRGRFADALSHFPNWKFIISQMQRKMKSKNLYAKAVKKTVFTNKGVKGIDLSFEIRCNKEDFVSSIRQSAKLLTACDLEKVKTFSIRFELLD